jgi:hypothetical protein
VLKEAARAGLVAIQNVRPPCGEPERAKVRALLAVDAKDWKKIDCTTTYVEIHGQDEGKALVRVAMVHAFALNASGSLDTVAIGLFTGPPTTKQSMQKILNDMRAQARSRTASRDPSEPTGRTVESQNVQCGTSTRHRVRDVCPLMCK